MGGSEFRGDLKESSRAFSMAAIISLSDGPYVRATEGISLRAICSESSSFKSNPDSSAPFWRLSGSGTGVDRTTVSDRRIIVR